MKRRPGVVAAAGLIGFGAMAAGFTGPLPESLRAIAALLVVLVLPAVLLERHVIRRCASSAPASLRALFSFLSWFSILALWSAAFTLLRAPFHVFALSTMWFVLALYAFAVLLPLSGRMRALPRLPAPRGFLVAAAACALFAAAVPPRLGVGDDSLDHIGYVRRIASMDAMRPAGVLAVPRDASAEALRPDPRKGALHPVAAFVCALSAANAVTLWRWLGVLLFPAAALAIVLFNGAFLRSRAATWSAAILALLSFHGTPFRFAGSSAHGESLAALWCWAMTALAVTAPPGPAWWILLAAGGVLVHVGVAMHAMVLAATVALLGDAWGMTRAERRRVWVPVSAGVAAGLVMRWSDLGGAVNAIHAHTQGVLFLAKEWFVASPMEILRLDGMLFLGGLVGLALVALAARTRADARAVLAAAVIPLAMSFVPWIATTLFHHASYMVFRSLLNIPVYAAIVVSAQWLGESWRARRPAALLFGVPAALVWLVVFARPLPRSLATELGAQTRARGAPVPVAAALQDAATLLPTGSVILSDPATSYALSALTSQRFVAVYGQHANPRDPFALDRLQAVRDVLSPYAAPSAAVAACRRFGVNYVVINGNPPAGADGFLPLWSREQFAVARARMTAMEQSFAFVDSAGGACIYRFDPGAPVSWAWAAQDQPVRVASLALAPCEVPSPAGDFTVTGISVVPESALPGDTVLVTLGYRHDAPSPFALPVVMHVRFDHDALDRAREVPGEKIWRRVSDGRAGVRSRFRADLVPGHGTYEPDLWPTGVGLCETFSLVVPSRARMGHYHVRLALAYDSIVPNFHLRDVLYNRDHYSGADCASFVVTTKATGSAP